MCIRDRSLSADLGRRAPALSAEAAALLQQYPFPGNVRELRNLVERALLVCPRDLLEADAFVTLMSTKASASSRSRGQTKRARSTRLRSSRTFPGNGYCCSSAAASADSAGARRPRSALKD